MTAQHTPGPWRVGDRAHTVYGPPITGTLPARIADVTPIQDRPANARLLAAAPDLLAACETVLDMQSEIMAFVDKDTGQVFSDVCGIARAAIAKAKGGEA